MSSSSGSPTVPTSSTSPSDESGASVPMKRLLPRLKERLFSRRNKSHDLTQTPSMANRQAFTPRGTATPTSAEIPTTSSGTNVASKPNVPFALSSGAENATHDHRSHGHDHSTGAEAKNRPTYNYSRLLPVKPAIFHGRESEVTNAVRLLVGHAPARIPILGAGGIGKTSLALVILHDHRVENRFGNRRYFLRCDSANSPDAVIRFLIDMLELTSTSGDPRSLVYSSLGSSPSVLVLDNFESVMNEDNITAVEELLQQLAGVTVLQLVVTMRATYPLEGIDWTPISDVSTLNVLSHEDALSTFYTISKIDRNTDQPIVIELLREIDYMPLAITLLARLISRGEKPPNLLKEWKKYSTSLLSPSNKKTREHNVEVSIGLSLFHIRAHSAEERLLFLCSQLPDGLYPDIAEILESNFDNGTGPPRRALTDLALINIGPSGEIRMLSPIRLYVLKKYSHPDLYNKLREIFLSLLRHSSHTITIGVMENLKNLNAFLTKEIDRLHGTASEELTLAVFNFSHIQQETTPSLYLIESLLGHIESDKDWATAIFHLGLASYMHCKQSKAQILLEEAQEIFKEIGEHMMHAECLRCLGEILYVFDHYDEGIYYVEEAQRIYFKIGNREGYARCLQTLGEIDHTLANYSWAKAHYDYALPIFRSVSNRAGRANCLRGLGFVQHSLKNHLPAQTHFKEALQIYKELGDPQGQANTLRGLGDVQFALGHKSEALEQMEQALQISSHVGDLMGQAACLQALGMIGFSQNPPLSITYLKQAKDIWKAVGRPLKENQCEESIQEFEDLLRSAILLI